MVLNSDAVVRTVLGDIAVSQLGHIQCHEHIWLRKGPSFEMDSALLLDDFHRSLRELCDYAKAGGRTIVDAQPSIFGGDPDRLASLSRESGVQIIGVTGFHKLAFLEDSSLCEMDEEALIMRFSSEIADGMVAADGGRSSAKAGMIKGAYDTDAFENPTYRKLFSAIARTASNTDVPIMIHTEKGNDILGLIRFFGQYGVDAHRLLICHMDRTCPDPVLLAQVLQTGCILCMDSIHRFKYVTEEQELGLIVDLCSAGYTRQLVLSLDTTSKRLRAYQAKDMGLDYILTVYRDKLQQAGLTTDQITLLCEKNAQTLFC